MTKETFAFQTEVGRLLDIVASSLYSNREIFLRELISNASDACDKLRHAALTSASLIDGDHDFGIQLSVDKKAKTITISDNGIGMNHDDLIETLGTIAQSGTNAFIDQLGKDDKTDLGLIGQFGVGFYSAFMVSNKVEVTTRKAGEAEAWLWVSDGKGEFSIESAERDERGTTVVMHIKKDAKEFLEDERVSHIVKTYSDHISFPVTLGEKTLNEASAIWTRTPKDITEEQHIEFYHHTSHAFDDPWLTIHNKIEGVVSYTNLFYIPTFRPFDLFEPERKGHVKLYVNRVFITDSIDGLLPPFLRFLRGVVDSEDLSLNISREMLQTDPKMAKISSGLVKRVLGELEKKAKKAPEEFAKFWEAFGVVLKEGLIEVNPHQERLMKLCRFVSSEQGELTTLSEYVERMKDGQDKIYYIIGDDAEQVANSPHLEGFKAKGVEVLMLIDPVDEFWVRSMDKFEDKVLVSITRSDSGLDDIKSDDDKDKDDDKAKDTPTLDTLIAALKMQLGDDIKDVRVSKNLTDSPVRLVADKDDMDMNLERMLRKQGQMSGPTPRILELNPDHAIINKLVARAEKEGAVDDALMKDAAYLLLDQARIADGEMPNDLAAFAKRLASVMEHAL